MVKIRQDAWLNENDVLLAETVLKHVREGSTQLSAFEEVGDALNRTAAACGFRWNAVVRKDYEEALEDAKRERKQAMRMLGNDFKRRGQQLYMATPEQPAQPQTSIPLSSLTLDTVIAYLVRLHHSGNDVEVLRWKQTAQAASESVQKLEQEVSHLQAENKTLRKDYEQFVQVMNRARRLITLDDENEHTAPIFTMEANGNLVAKEPPIQ